MRLVAVIASILAALAGGPVARADGRAERPCPPRPPTTTHPVVTPRWLSGAIVTEYYPVREAWFSGKRVRVPGLPGTHRVDWLYGPHGVAMNGEGLAADGRFDHFAGPYGTGWVNADGRPTLPCWNGVWTNGSPAWLDFGWRNGRGQVTFPLAAGGWSNGAAARYLAPPPQLRFAAGRTRPLPFWHTVAVDPELIPLGSRVFIPAYCDTPAKGWFRALDTGGAIIALHVDVYRAPPQTLELHALRGQRIYVVPAGASPSRRALPSCRS